MNYATADELIQKEKIRKQENIPNNDFHKKANKENDIHTQKISKELEEKTIWKYWKYLDVKFRINVGSFFSVFGVWVILMLLGIILQGGIYIYYPL